MAKSCSGMLNVGREGMNMGEGKQYETHPGRTTPAVAGDMRGEMNEIRQ